MFSQIDPRWRDVRLGTGNSTIGQEGCLICCIAQILADSGELIDPASLNRWLCRHGGYTGGNRFVFASVDRLGLWLVDVRDWRKAPANIDEIRRWKRDLLHVIIAVNATPWSSYHEHWVLVEACLSDDLLILDPLLPPEAQQPTRLLPRYARPDWDLARAVHRAVVYRLGVTR